MSPALSTSSLLYTANQFPQLLISAQQTQQLSFVLKITKAVYCCLTQNTQPKQNLPVYLAMEQCNKTQPVL
jgi:hypothetical protein